MNSGIGQSAVSFRDAYCRHYGCASQRYEKSALRRCFPPLVRPLGAILLAVRPMMFHRELTMLGRLGGLPNEVALRGELDGYVYENQRDKPFRVETLGLRLSRRRFLRIYRTVMGPPPERSVPSPAPASATAAGSGQER